MPETNTFSPAKRPNIKTFLANRENVVEHAGTGFMLPESTARILDEHAKTLPKDFTYRRLSAAPSEFDLPEGERTDVSFITTDAVDRDGDVVLPQGIDWSTYNGVVPLSHDYKSLPVGVNWWIRPKMSGNNNGLVAKTYYPTKPDDWGTAPWLPSAVLHLMQQAIPVCTGKSIGFLPLEIRNATTEEKARRPDWKDAPIVSRAMGLEYSVAPVPAQPMAEMQAISKMLATKDLAPEVVELCERIKAYFKDHPILATGTTATESMPACPKCMSPENVRKKDDDEGVYLCMKCMKEFKPDSDGDYDGDGDDDRAKALSLNHECVSRAKRLIAAGKCNHGEWSAPNGGDRKAEDCLAIDAGASDAAKYKYPIIKGGEVYAKAVGSAAAYAEKNGEGAVAKAAHSLSDLIKQHSKILDALAAPFYTPEVYAAMKRREAQELADRAAVAAKRAIDLAIAAVAGKC